LAYYVKLILKFCALGIKQRGTSCMSDGLAYQYRHDGLQILPWKWKQ